MQLVTLYTGSLGETDGGVKSYVDLIRANATAIVEALQ